MDPNKTTLERAFELACSGRFSTVEAIRLQLRDEGYNPGQIYGRVLSKQLRELIKKAQADAI